MAVSRLGHGPEDNNLGPGKSEKVEDLKLEAAMEECVERWVWRGGLGPVEEGRLRAALRRLGPGWADVGVESELCFYVVSTAAPSAEERRALGRLLSQDPFSATDLLGPTSRWYGAQADGSRVLEFGPRPSFTTAFSTNAVSVARAAGLRSVRRVEPFRRFRLSRLAKGAQLGPAKALLHDPMLEMEYPEPPTTFLTSASERAEWERVDVMGDPAALARANEELGLGLDDWDLRWTQDLFQNKLRRNPSDVELFDLAQSNSEHSRHWFFKGRLFIDGQERPSDLFSDIQATNKSPLTNANSRIAFCDNSSAIRGFDAAVLRAAGEAGAVLGRRLGERREETQILLTAETHNFPTGVCPEPGAATGTGGRIRDVQAAGRGGEVRAGLAGYSFGQLLIPGYALPWEDASLPYPANLAHPLDIAIGASDGASEYGNKFGEPVIGGFTRCFAAQVAGERREYVKPIMFSAGLGSIPEELVQKGRAEKDMLVVKLGGPVYRIGVGGGAASSTVVQGLQGQEKLEFGAVQRGDPEMGQKLNRAIRALVELGPDNPVVSIHDQGAGGNGNVVKELVEEAGAVVSCSALSLGDPSLSVREVWGAEYQESNALLLRPQHRPLLEEICRRERCPVDFFGRVTGSTPPTIVLEDFEESSAGPGTEPGSEPVRLDLGLVLGKVPRKEFHLARVERLTRPLSLPTGLTVAEGLGRVLRLASVASKRWLTNKVDRSVTGLVAGQQCVGPLHTPLADAAVTALSHVSPQSSVYLRLTQQIPPPSPSLRPAAIECVVDNECL